MLGAETARTSCSFCFDALERCARPSIVRLETEEDAKKSSSDDASSRRWLNLSIPQLNLSASSEDSRIDKKSNQACAAED